MQKYDILTVCLRDGYILYRLDKFCFEMGGWWHCGTKSPPLIRGSGLGSLANCFCTGTQGAFYSGYITYPLHIRDPPQEI